MSAEEEEARRIAEMGKPILGEHSRLEVVIEESYEFKVNHRFKDSLVWMHSGGLTPVSSAAGCNCVSVSFWRKQLHFVSEECFADRKDDEEKNVSA